MPLHNNGERQVGATLDKIRADHRARYEWAAQRLSGKKVVDAGCGIGYGSKILAERDCVVRAYDYDKETIEFAKQHYNHDGRIAYAVGNLYDVEFPQGADAICAFEVIEHVAQPEVVLRRFHKMAGTLLLSVPNEEVFPYREEYAHHVRHYTPNQVERLLMLNGWRVTEWWGQKGPLSPVERGVNGRTLVLVAERIDEPMPIPERPDDDEVLKSLCLPGKELPKSVALVAMGRSKLYYADLASHRASRFRVADEVWAIQGAAATFAHDRVFSMDDLAVQELRTDNDYISGMLSWMPTHHAPIYTPRRYERYPTSVEYPLEWVVNRTGACYFTTTPPYAVAMAIAMGVKDIHLFGMDYEYQGNRAKGELGRACLEWWMGYGYNSGVTFHLPPNTSLLNSNRPDHDKMYGYHTEWLTVEGNGKGNIRVTRRDREPNEILTPEEIELWYSHSPEGEAQAMRLAAQRLKKED